MSTDTLEKLIKRRSNYKGRLTRIYNFVDDQANLEKVYELQARHEELADLYQKYNATQGDIELIDDKNSILHAQERSATEDKYFHYRAKLAEIIKDHELNQTSDSCHSAPQASAQPKTPGLKLPYLQIPNFDGNLSEWSNFKALFDGIIDSHEHLTPLQKFQYLKSLLRGEAANLINSIAVNADNYHRALGILVKRYENKLLAINFHIQNIMSVAQISRNNLKDFLTNLQQSIDSLTSLHVPVNTWDLLLIYIIVQKLDQSLRSAWELNRKTEDLPTFNELVEFLNHRARAFELMYGNLQNVTKNSTSVTKNNRSKFTCVSTHVGTVASNCGLCNMSHALYQCPSFLEMTPVKRNEYVKDKKLC